MSLSINKKKKKNKKFYIFVFFIYIYLIKDKSYKLIKKKMSTGEIGYNNVEHQIRQSFIGLNDSLLPKRKSRCQKCCYIFTTLFYWMFLSSYGIVMINMEYQIKSPNDIEVSKLYTVPVGISTMIVAFQMFYSWCCKKEVKPIYIPYRHN